MNVVEGNQFVLKPYSAVCWEILTNFLISLVQDEQKAVDELVTLEEFVGDFLYYELGFKYQNPKSYAILSENKEYLQKDEMKMNFMTLLKEREPKIVDILVKGQGEANWD